MKAQGLASAVVLCLLAAACAGSPAAAPRNSVVVGITGAVTTVNPLLSRGTESEFVVYAQLFSTLASERPDFQQGPPSFAPDLAESWEFSEDRSTLTFHLQGDRYWSSGAPVTARDVRFTWLAQTSPEIGWLYSSDKADISDVEVVDDRTVVFHFSRPSATQFLNANEGFILPESWGRLPFSEWRSDPSWFLDHLVTSGPFGLASWEPPERIVLARSAPRADAERSSAPGTIERVALRFLTDATTVVPQLLGGELDFAWSVRPRDAIELGAREDVELIAFPTRQFTFVAWNVGRSLFREAGVRRALARAIDRQAIVETLWFGRAVVGASPIVSSVWAHDDSLAPIPHDPVRARRDLLALGWQDSDADGWLDRDGEVFRFELLTNTEDELRWDVLQMIRADLAEIGVDARPRRVESNTFLNRLFGHEFEAALSAFAIPTTLDMSFLFHSDPAIGAYNYPGFANAEVDRLLEEIAAARDLRRVEPQLHQLQRVLQREQPILVLWEPIRTVAFRRGLENVEPNELNVLGNLAEWRWRAE